MADALSRRLLITAGAGLAVTAAGCGRVGGGDGSTTTTTPGVVRRISYGPAAAQYGDLRTPAGRRPSAGWPTVVLVHGGDWAVPSSPPMMEALALDLALRGVASWNLQYRRVGEEGGGWPGTLTDVAAAVDLLAKGGGDRVLDRRRLAIVGHSAGGHLAVWLALRGLLPAGAPGARPLVVPKMAVSLAGALDLLGAGIGDGVARFLGGRPTEVPDRYRLSSPAALVPSPVPIVAVQGTSDMVVSPEQANQYQAADRAAGGQLVEVVPVPGGNHVSVMDPGGPGWKAAVARLGGALRFKA